MKTNFKKQRTILTLMWGMLFCFNLFMCLIIPDPSFLSWICVGISFGAVMILLTTNPIMNLNDKLINGLQEYVEILRYELEESKKKRK